jgi:hypothetical protein
MEFQHEKEMQKHGLTYSDLPEDAQTGIDQIADIKKALNMLEKSGKKASPKTIKKVKAMDKWVCYEIYDHVNETNKNNEEMPYNEEEVIDEIEGQVKDDMEANVNNSKGMQVEQEIKNLYDNGVKTIDIEELKTKAPTCYDILFDTYDPEEENGLETTNYSLIEGKEDDIFHVKKR